jgi:hypothetical protein
MPSFASTWLDAQRYCPVRYRGDAHVGALSHLPRREQACEHQIVADAAEARVLLLPHYENHILQARFIVKRHPRALLPPGLDGDREGLVHRHREA